MITFIFNVVTLIFCRIGVKKKMWSKFANATLALVKISYSSGNRQTQIEYYLWN